MAHWLFPMSSSRMAGVSQSEKQHGMVTLLHITRSFGTNTFLGCFCLGMTTVRLSVGKASCVSFSIATAAQVLANTVTPVVSTPGCGLLLSVAVLASLKGDEFMAVVSSMMSEVRFHGVLGP